MTWVTITGAGTTTATKFHGDVMNKINDMFGGVDITDTVSINVNVTWAFAGLTTLTGGADLVGANADNIQNLIHDLSTATSAINFAGDELQEISIVANTTFIGTGYATGKSKVIKITTDGTLRTLAFPAGWVFVGAKPADQAATKEGILSLTCFTGAEAGVIASYAVEE